MKNRLVALIDADSIIHITSYNYRDCEDPEYMFAKVGEFVQQILSAVNCSHYQGFIGGTKCFRYEVAKTAPYKGSRKEKPEWIQKWEFPIKAYLRDTFGFIVCDGVEADDAVGIYAEHLRKEDTNFIICGCDKDLKTIYGNHYNYSKLEFCYVTEVEAARFFWKQMITGDSSDGIPGCKGKGPVAAQIIDTTDEPAFMRRFVEQMYHSVYSLNWETHFEEMYTLLSMLKEPAYGFSICELKTTADAFALKFSVPSHRPMKTGKILEDLGIFD